MRALARLFLVLVTVMAMLVATAGVATAEPMLVDEVTTSIDKILRVEMTPSGDAVYLVGDPFYDYGMGGGNLRHADLPAGTVSHLTSYPHEEWIPIEGWEITPDGSRIVFEKGHFEIGQDWFSQMYSVPTTGGPITTLSAVSYSIHRFAVTPDSSTLVFTAEHNSTHRLYSVPVAGGTVTELDGNVDWLTDFAVSPDSTRVVYRTGGSLYSIPVGGGTRTTLSAGTLAGFEIAPDSSRVVFHRTLTAPARNQLASVPLAGGSVQGLISDTTQFFWDFAITPNSSRVVFRASLDAAGGTELGSVPIAGGAVQRITPELAAGRDVARDFAITPDSARVVYRADAATDERFELYSTGTAANTSARISAAITDGDVTEFTVSENAAWAVYRTVRSNGSHLHSVPVAGGGATMLSKASPNGDGDVQDGWLVSPDSKRVLFVTDQDVETRYELFSVPIAGGHPTQVSPAIPYDHDVVMHHAGQAGRHQQMVAISPYGWRVVLATGEFIWDIFYPERLWMSTMVAYRCDGRPATLVGTLGHDTLQGTGGNDSIIGLGGNDTLRGLGGDDCLLGGIGSDTLYGFGGNDSLFGLDGNDILYGGNGNDLLGGGNGNDTLLGEGGNDRLVGAGGPDTMNGGPGWDRFYGGFGGDVLVGGAGSDRALYHQAPAGITATTSSVHVPGWGTDTLYGIPQIFGSNFDDTITGNGLVNVLGGNGGDDTIRGHGGNDTLLGGNGKDILLGGGGNDTLNGQAGFDRISPGAGNDTIDGGAGNDRAEYAGAPAGITATMASVTAPGWGTDTLVRITQMIGSAFADTIQGNNAANLIGGRGGADDVRGGGGDDRLFGWTGNDTINGQGGNDELFGEAGNDILIGGPGTDTANGGPGNDTCTAETTTAC